MVATVLAQSTLKPPVRLFLAFQGRPEGADGFVADALGSLARSLALFVDEYAKADLVVLPLWRIFESQRSSLLNRSSSTAFKTVIHNHVAAAAAARKEADPRL